MSVGGIAQELHRNTRRHRRFDGVRGDELDVANLHAPEAANVLLAMTRTQPHEVRR